MQRSIINQNWISGMNIRIRGVVLVRLRGDIGYIYASVVVMQTKYVRVAEVLWSQEAVLMVHLWHGKENP